ncbi:DsbC family protein [Dokdonella sp. MW10]|uniref:DsbC family protein n=1 Tax=Dokdonella sp. MW10 TaxID=2992926 RepID=UPI003F80F750
MLRFASFLLILVAVLASPVHAAEGDAARRAIQKTAPMLPIKGFGTSALPGFYEGIIGGKVVYATPDGAYVVRGAQVERSADGEDLTDASMAARRLEVLAGVGADQRMSYAPRDPKYRITVFTDPDCPYCRRLHGAMAEYNALGIAIDYVFFPLSIHPDADKKSASIWCAPDRNAAYDRAMAGQSVDRLTCPNPVSATMAAGVEIGVNSTPTAITPAGRVVNSTVLLSPRRLLAELQRADAAESSPSR